MREQDDPRFLPLSLISIENSKINLLPPKVFLFGGSLERKTVRSQLYHYILTKKPKLSEALVLVEEFKDWLHDSIYPDLLTFESDLAETASLVIISLESAGSLAELGSFSVNEKLKDKLIILLSENHYNEDSYIKLGPLRQIKSENIISYPYNEDDVENTFGEYLEEISELLSIYLEEQKKTESFNKENKGHIAFLIHDLIHMFHALKKKEITLYLKSFDISISSREIDRLLFLLKSIDLIKAKRSGNVDYYLAMSNDRRVEFSNKYNEKKFDRNSVSISAVEFYENSTTEKSRYRLLKSTQGSGL